MDVQGKKVVRWEQVKGPALLVFGPLGCYVAYLLVFVVRYVDPDRYPLLARRHDAIGIALEVVGAGVCLLIAIAFLRRAGPVDAFRRIRQPLAPLILIALLLGTSALMALSVYQVLGSLSPNYLLTNYARYQFEATVGGAWIILACYAVLYLLLADMFFGGVTRLNGAVFLAGILVVSVSGGRSILMLFALAFVVLLLCQQVKFRHFVAATALTMAIVGASFIVVTDLRDTRTTEQIERQARPLNDKPLRPTDVFEDMNYNAAFITEDVLFGLQAGTVSPSLYALEDARWRLMPRSLSPNKPISSAETITLYPEVAARGTNITFPLKANIMMHSGLGGYHLDWLVVMASQLAFLAGIAARNRRPNVFAFGAFFFGCAFALVARGGILNARLLDQIACLALAYMSYRLLLWVQNVIWARNQLQTA